MSKHLTIHASQDPAYVRTEPSNVTDGAYLDIKVRDWTNAPTCRTHVAYIHLTRDETTALRDRLSAILNGEVGQ